MVGAVRRSFGQAALAGALVVSFIVGCSSHQSAAPSTSAKPPVGVSVTIDGRDQNVKGPVTCDTSGGLINIAIGDKINGTSPTAYSATLTDADPPEVRSVGLGEADGQGLAYLQGFYDDTAQATKNGKSYRITGTASGGLGKPAKRFEMNVTCP